ncbi:uncharacterized protein LOC125495481 [Beta vulgaris subsp. vulgaris]|uniref:uncharacterized protein LOC125495481 n=1 Tax=Beta vulgaris subsp. vulgaris TaxID=3555 RepID=UPI00203724EB|nr:uncharacterized protein LOC125495481 [Beta vulgaris subsp. vulgaris]
MVRWRMMEKGKVQRGCYLMWNLWSNRNSLLFENSSPPFEVVCQRVRRQVDEFSDYSRRIYGGPTKHGRASSPRWTAPPRGVVKLNSDASLSADGWIRLGVVARDAEGRVLFSAVKRVRAYWPVEVAECKAAYMAARLAKNHGMQEVIFESDSQVVTNRLSRAAVFFSDLDAILGDVFDICRDFISVSFSHVKRDGNSVAHNLARIVPFGVEQRWEFHCPSDVAPYVLMDTLSMD